MAQSIGRVRVLLVQCCKLPQFVYIARLLGRRHPEWDLEALVVDRASGREVSRISNAFERVHRVDSGASLGHLKVDRVVYPLLNRGFAGIKRAASAIRGEAFEADYEGRLRPLRRWRVWLSSVRSPNRATGEFAGFLAEFPGRRLGRRILQVHSAHPTLISATKEIWSRWFPEDARVTKVAGGVEWREFRRLRRAAHDSAVVFLSGERGYPGLKSLPFLLRVPQILAVDENGHCFEADPASLAAHMWSRFWGGVSLPRQKPRVLLVQTESPPYVIDAVEKLKEEKLFPDAEIILLCRRDDASMVARTPGVHRMIVYRGGSLREKLRLFFKLRKLRPDFAAAVFSGRGVFRPAKALFLSFADRPLLAFNAGMDCYWVTPRSLPRLWRKDTPRHPDVQRPGTPIALVQTEAWRYTLEALRRLRGPGLYPRSRVTVVCSRRDANRFRNEPGVEEVLTFEDFREAGWLNSWRRVRGGCQIAAAVFTGRPVYRKQKLFFWLLARRPRLVFNARLDAYWLEWRNVSRTFRGEPLLFGLQDASKAEALLIQTESEEITRRALERMLSQRVVPQKSVAVFCREDLRERFAALPAVSRVYAYRPGDWSGNLSTLYRMARIDRDVAAAVLSGRSVFRLQKLLFFTLPARNRLVFNENLDCFYLSRSRAGRLLRLPSLAPSMRRRQTALAQAARVGLKGLLFFPRFAYLLFWVTAAKVKRARRTGLAASKRI